MTQVYVPRERPERDTTQTDTPGTSWFDTVIATAGPGYAFTPDQLHTIAGEWETLAERYKAAKRTAQQIALVEGPGAEYASINNAEKIRASGLALMQALDERANYCETMAGKFRTALSSYSRAEGDAAAEVKARGKF
ncbi:hypothetical protein [Prauserella muralis]|uniref:hypothetical protein n=1 Tax=Prauserella muralis TaxID=588067 RepID=UPI001FE2F584|nr:hypothetical protein [Prauserella muralis]